MLENYKVKKHPFKELRTGYTLLYAYKIEAFKHKQRDKQGRKWIDPGLQKVFLFLSFVPWNLGYF